MTTAYPSGYAGYTYSVICNKKINMNYILAIGINEYESCVNLNNPVDDIEKIIDLLTTIYDFEKENVTTLLNENATRENIINQLSYYTDLSSNDNLVILFAGHGEYDAKIELGFLLTQESVPQNRSTYLEYSSVFNYLKAINTKHTFFISDSCFAGSLFNPRKAASEIANEKLYEIPSRWALTSGRIEPVSDGVPGKNSPFADSIIKILKENPKESISIMELTNQIISKVASTNKQVPRGEPLEIRGHEGGQMIFYKKGTKKPTISKSNSKLDSILNDYKKTKELIEDAENKNLTGTSKKLEDELSYIDKTLDNLLRFNLRDKRTNEFSSILKDLKLIDDKTKEQIIEAQQVKHKKNQAVKNQQYDSAADLRDLETKLTEQIEGEISSIRIDSIQFNPDDFDKLIAYVKIVMDYSGRIYQQNDEKYINDAIFQLYKTKELIAKDIYGEYKSKSIWNETLYNLHSKILNPTKKYRSKN